MRRILLDFVDFWPDFDKTDNFFQKIISQHYEIEISDHPDFIIFSVFGHRHKQYKCTRIFYTGENVRPNTREYDYAFTFDYNQAKNHYRLPLYVLYLDTPNQLVKSSDLGIDKIIAEKTQFCNFIYSNKHCKHRNNFFHKLSKYKRVDSGGRYLNNIGGPVKDKLSFISNYKFTIAFENSFWPGYTTEKIIHPMLVYSLPIYWGNELIYRDFNPRSFLNYADFRNEDELIEKVIQIDKDDCLFEQYLREPYYHDNKVNQYADHAQILKQFDMIFKQTVIC